MKTHILFAGLLVVLSMPAIGQAELQKAMKRVSGLTRNSFVPTIPLPVNASSRNITPTEAATITSFTPSSAARGGIITVTGDNFHGKLKAWIGTKAATVMSQITSTVTIAVDDAETGNITIKNTKGKGVSANPFIFIPPPKIDNISPWPISPGVTMTINGFGFTSTGLLLLIDGSLAIVNCVSSTVMTATATGPVTDKKIFLSNANGQAIYPEGNNNLKALADFTLPDPGDGLIIIPTPTFMYNNISTGKVGFSAKVWGNSLGTDTTYQRVASKFLIPQLSTFGMQLSFNRRLSRPVDSYTLGLINDLNFLVKKISYYTKESDSTFSFSPFIYHHRVGLLLSFAKETFHVGAYMNILSVLSKKDEFGSFFRSGGTNVFAYPELQVSGLFDISPGGNQALKFELGMLVNTSKVNVLYKENSGVIPTIKFGLISKL